MLSFTSDRDELRQAFERLQPAPGSGMSDCMDLNDYWADLVDRHNGEALKAAAAKVTRCGRIEADPGLYLRIEMAAGQKVYESRRDVRRALAMLQQTVKLLAAAPGERTIVLISGGFLLRQEFPDATEVFNSAARAGVVVNALNSRRLAADLPMNCPPSVSCAGLARGAERNSDREADNVHDETLAAIADATGGTYFHNHNDYDGAFRRLARSPEFWVPVKATFPVQPGVYKIRVVVRDGEERRSGTVSSSVEVGGGR